MLDVDGLGSALKDATRATATLYNAVQPLATSVWCCRRAELRAPPSSELTDREIELTQQGTLGQFWYPTDSARSPEIHEMLSAYVATLNVQSVDHFVEKEYLDKYFVFRNWYEPESLRRQTNDPPWFIRGPPVPEPMRKRLRIWWTDHVPSGWKWVPPERIPCPKYEASAGVVMKRSFGRDQWAYCKKGPNWPEIQEGTAAWTDLVSQVIRSRRPEWLADGFNLERLLKVREPALELLALERPVIRTESGPLSVRFARSSSGNLYLAERGFVLPIQNNRRWHDSTEYIGIARNTCLGATKAVGSSGAVPWVGTHGDDWVAWCPQCKRFHSGDWSKWDRNLSARLILASKDAQFRAMQHLLDREQQTVFIGLAYLAIRCPIVWPWDIETEKPRLDIYPTLGKVRSGSGSFIMDNNAINHCGTSDLLERTHQVVDRQYPCRSKMFWPTFSMLARGLYGWDCKPDAQLTHPHGFVACRCIHTLDSLFVPRPCVSSVIRNYVNPDHDPLGRPANAPDVMIVRFRDVNKTLAWSPAAERVMSALAEQHLSAGVRDPLGESVSDADLQRAIQRTVGRYSTLSYLDGQDADPEGKGGN